jgi:hypothetical protein
VLPRYAEGPLGAGSVGVGLAVGAASLTALLAQPPAGRLGDLRDGIDRVLQQRVGRLIEDGPARQRAPTRRRRWRITVDDARHSGGDDPAEIAGSSTLRAGRGMRSQDADRDHRSGMTPNDRLRTRSTRLSVSRGPQWGSRLSRSIWAASRHITSRRVLDRAKWPV